MRFRHLDVRCFGPLRDARFDLASDTVLVFGPNESGKSSFRSALETIAYGFEPASRDSHPLAQWGAEEGRRDLHLEAELQLDGGATARVERVLQSTGRSRTRGAGEPFEGTRQGNAALPCVSALPRAVFRALYSLELEQLAALEQGVQQHVDRLLLPETDALDLRPGHEVRRELAEVHLALWRPDNRGRPAAKKLREELAEARAHLGAMARVERELRAERDERARLASELERLKQRKGELERVARDAPFLQQCFELAQRRRRLGAPVDLRPLEGLELADPAGLTQRIQALEDSLHEPSAVLARPELPAGERETRVRAAAPEIERVLGAAAHHAAGIARLAENRERAQALRARAARELSGALAAPASPAHLARAEALPFEALRALQAGWADGARAGDRAGAAPRPAWALAVGAAGLALALLAAAGLADARLSLPGALLLAISLAWSSFARPGARAAAPAPRPPALDAALAGLPVAPELLESPSGVQRLVECLARARTDAAAADEAERVAAAEREQAARREASWRRLGARLGLPEPGEPAEPARDGEPPLLVARLADALSAAREAEARERLERERRERAQLLIDAATPQLERDREHLRRVGLVLRTAEPDAASPEEAHARVALRLREQAFVRERESELRRDPRWGELKDDARPGAPEPPPGADWLPEVTDRRQAEIGELEARIGDATKRLGEISGLLERDEGSVQARAVDAVRDAEERMAALLRERDRLALLESIFDRAEREFREAHQPDVLRRASLYLERITLGRYGRLDYRGAEGGGLFVQPRGAAEPVRVGHPISRGTLDQIFLSLRLGLLDHLDEERETLPLVLDDALLRMDAARRRETYALLAELAPRRQVFLLTCHDAIAAEAERALHQHRIDLKGP